MSNLPSEKEVEFLRSVAEAAKALTLTVIDYSDHHVIVSEPALVALESALEDAGYGMTEEELEELEADREQDEDYDPYEAIGESRFGLPGGGKNL